MRLPPILEEPVPYQVNLHESTGPKRTGGDCSAYCSMTPRSPLDERGTLVGQVALSSVSSRNRPLWKEVASPRVMLPPHIQCTMSGYKGSASLPPGTLWRLIPASEFTLGWCEATTAAVWLLSIPLLTLLPSFSYRSREHTSVVLQQVTSTSGSVSQGILLIEYLKNTETSKLTNQKTRIQKPQALFICAPYLKAVWPERPHHWATDR